MKSWADQQVQTIALVTERMWDKKTILTADYVGDRDCTMLTRCHV